MDQRGNRGKNVLGCRGIEGAGRFVEDKDASCLLYTSDAADE